MIKHIVLFKLADKAEGKSRAENALYIKEQLEALKDKISVIQKMDVFINDKEASDDNYDIILDSEFANLEDLNTYINHPDHKLVGEYVSKVRVSRAAIDYNI